MPPRPKFTREEIVDAAVDVIRERSVEAITAQAIADKLGTSTRPLFTYFDTLEALRAAATERARQIYDGYAEAGLHMTPAFKGFAMAYIHFAMREPSLFRLLFMRKADNLSFPEFLDQEGHHRKILQAVSDLFRVTLEEAKWLYENMWLYAHGIATLCASEVVRFDDEEVARKLGIVCRGLLMSLRAGDDPRTAILPGEDVTMPGSLDSYVKTPKP